MAPKCGIDFDENLYIGLNIKTILDLFLYDFLNFVSSLNSSLTFILGAAAVLRLLLFARTPVVRYPNGGENFYKMDNLSSSLGK